MERERDIALLETVKAYIALTKPRIIELLLVAAIPAMLQADRGHVHVGLILLTLFGGWLGAAAAQRAGLEDQRGGILSRFRP